MDLGNSQAKWAMEHELAMGIVQRSPSTDSATLISRLDSLLPPTEVHIASVLAAERLDILCDWMRSYWHLNPVLAQTRVREQGVLNGYRQPEQLGVDRWLGLLAARGISKQPLLVVDCGTATTLDAMDHEGRHLGGMILPGLKLFLRCLQQGTDLPKMNEAGDVTCFATDTASGITAGAMLATTSSVEATMGRMRQEWGESVLCLLTGGFSSRVAENLSVPHTLVPNLILQGLALQAGPTDR
jgi:type III pantothenate kinase